MSVSKYGQIALSNKVESPTGYEITVTADGSATAVVTSTTNADNFALSRLPKINSKHPKFPALLLWETRATREAGNIMKIISTYKGVGVSNPRSLAVHEFNISSTAEPLLTHPKFAGTPVLGGVQFPLPMINAGEVTAVNTAIDSNRVYGKYSTFFVNRLYNGQESPLGLAGSEHKSTQIGRLYYMLRHLGIESYQCPTGTLRRTYVDSDVKVDVYAGLGYILLQNEMDNKVGHLAQFCRATNRQMIIVGLTWRIQGGLANITQDFQLSAPGGANQFLYTRPLTNDNTKLTAADKAQAGDDAT